MVQLRVSCRAGVRARAMLVGGAVDGPLAATLTEGWAYPTRVADVHIDRWYDRVRVTVVDERSVALDVGLDDPRPIAPDDIQHVVGLNPGSVDGVGERLIQVEPHLEPTRAERPARPDHVRSSLVRRTSAAARAPGRGDHLARHADSPAASFRATSRSARVGGHRGAAPLSSSPGWFSPRNRAWASRSRRSSCRGSRGAHDAGGARRQSGRPRCPKRRG